MNRNVTKTVTHHILPCLGLLIVEAVYLVELDEYATVVSTDINNGKIYTDKGYCYPSGVIKWPWELEQKEEGDKQ